MSCLLRILDDSSKSLHPSCREVLVERRKMWSYAAMVNRVFASDFITLDGDS